MKSFEKIKKCRICSSRNLKNVINLKKQYIQSSFVKKGKPKPYLKKIPLQLLLCQNCSLVQLSHTTNKDILYKNYWYESGINFTMRQHLNELVTNGTQMLKKKKKINVLDIGCNDGTLLNFYPKHFKKYGIDPSQIIKKINKKKISVIQDYFPLKKNSKKLLNKKFDIITSIAMFYDLENPNLFVNKIKKYLNQNGFWIFELSYLVDMLKLNSFDTICHEHLEYYSLTSLEYLMKKHNLKIFKVSKNTINGGSIRCFVTHKNNFIYDKKNNIKFYKRLLLIEKKLKIEKNHIYDKFFLSINNIRKKLLSKINSILKNKNSIYVLGASTKGNTILQFLEIDNKIIPYAIERNKEKIGAKTIGSNIKIVSEKFVKQNEPDFKLVLPWHFQKEIVEREINYLKNGGNLIFPLPKLSLVNYKNYKKYVK